MRACVAVAMLAMAGAASGCGYALAGRGSYLPKDIKTVAIPPLENRTNVSRLETILTDRIRTEFIGRNRQYKVVTEEAGADAVLRAELIGFSTQTAGLNAQQLDALLQRRDGLTGTHRLVDSLAEGLDEHVLATIRSG